MRPPAIYMLTPNGKAFPEPLPPRCSRRLPGCRGATLCFVCFLCVCSCGCDGCGSGRFDVGKKICLSMSGRTRCACALLPSSIHSFCFLFLHCWPLDVAPTDFHPETWNPVWGVSTILMGLLSFMVSPHSLFIPSSTQPHGATSWFHPSFVISCPLSLLVAGGIQFCGFHGGVSEAAPVVCQAIRCLQLEVPHVPQIVPGSGQFVCPAGVCSAQERYTVTVSPCWSTPFCAVE